MTRRPGSGWLAALGVVLCLVCRLYNAGKITVLAAAPPETRATAETPTWPVVAPILYANCTTCHHPHGNGPFSLMTYADGRRWGTQVAQVTASRYMPPWLPAHGYGDFADERLLSEAQIATLAAWVKAGMPEGDPGRAPAAPSYTDDWLGGKPDLILTVERPFTLPADGSDQFHNFILPFPLKQKRYVRAMEIRPSAPEVVHHANALIDRTASLRREHPADWQNGVSGMELAIDAGNRFDPDGHFLFWKADSPVIAEPPGMAWEIDPGNDLVLNMHLKPSGRSVPVTAQVGLYFTADPPTRQPMLLQLEHDGALDIPAGDAHFVVEDHLTLSQPVSVLGIYPHAHYLGKDLQGWATLPDGAKRPLIWVHDWDLDRQAVYRFKEPVALPKGATLHMRYVYDNSAANVHNPHTPPVRVRAGNRSEDEMGHLWVQVLPAATVDAGIDPRLPLEVDWMRRRLEKEPDDAVARYNLASALQAEHDLPEAVANYRRGLLHNGSDPRFLNGLGTALEGEGDWKAAQAAWEQAVAAAPDACDARFNLAQLDLKHALPAAAEAQFRSMLTRCPPDAAVHSGLGVALLGEGRTDAAEAQFDQALQLDPNDFTVNYNRGAAHLEGGDLPTATRELARAVAANEHDLDAREAFASALAQGGQTAQALAQLQAAEPLAPADPVPHSLASQLLAAEGRLADAIAEARQSVALGPADADAWNNLGVLEARHGDRTDAAAALRQALALHPGHAQATANLRHLEAADARNNTP